MLAKNPISDLSFLWGNIAQEFQGRSQAAFDHFYKKATADLEPYPTRATEFILNPWQWAGQCREYAVDYMQRSVLFWDTLRQRGDNFLDHEKAGKPPLLHFKLENVLDARQFERPVNYALVRIEADAEQMANELRGAKEHSEQLRQKLLDGSSF